MTRDSFEIRLSAAQQTELTSFCVEQLTNAQNAKAAQDTEVEYWHLLYEQARTRTGRNAPWPDAADLTSYLASEKIDALQARIMRTIWVDPIWTVEGWGDAASRAPFVEEFHQWKAEEERLQSVLDKLVLISLIEPRGLLEVSEGTETRLVRKRIQAKAVLDPATGGLIFDEKGQAQPVIGEDGRYEEAGPNDPTVELDVDSPEPVRSGPNYRIIPYRDSVIIPGHARDRSEIRGYGKRFTKRIGELQRQSRGKAALYDQDAVDRIATVTDVEPNQALERSRTSVSPESGPQADKDLWELLLLLDLNLLFDAKGLPLLKDKTYSGERWYVITLHLDTQQILRVQHDDLDIARYFPVILFPRPDRVTEGFSVIGHKLLTVIEEHTAVRNMRGDRSSLANGAPIKRLQGALWDPNEQPWGPKAVIDVRDHRELEAMQVPDVTQALIAWEQNCERTAERIMGVNDIASGQVAQESRTLGEIQMATEQSFVRMDLITRRFNEFMEDLAQVRHAIWQRVLAERKTGVQAPQSMISGLEGRGVSIDESLPEGKITAQLLQGPFRFKPRGSVETADPQRMRADTMGLIGVLPQLLQGFPMLIPMFQTPQAARAILRQVLRAFRWENTQAFIGSPSQDLDAQMQSQLAPMLQMLQGAMGAPMPGMPPGAPMGAPPPILAAPPVAPGPVGPQ